MDFFIKYFIDRGINQQPAEYLSTAIVAIIVIAACILVNIVAKKIVVRAIKQMVKHDRIKWNDIVARRKIFQRFAFFIPGIIVYISAPIFGSAQMYIQKYTFIYILIVSAFVAGSLLDVLNDYYNTLPISNLRPIKGLIQIAKIVTFVVLAIVIVAGIIDKSPFIMLSGLGALAAVFSFVFKDLILGLVAGIQLTSNDMLRIGDWIEVAKYGADGEVIELSLTTVKVQNFDKTIITLPAYGLISDSFKNYRGMLESGGRRIKRSIYIDLNSISFCSPELINDLKAFKIIEEYILERESEITEYNLKIGVGQDDIFNGRQLTNIGLFRIYVLNYLKNHPGIHKELTMLVRQLPLGEHGLPLEIYAFSKGVEWSNFERVQSDIFDHLLAIIEKFQLRAYQSPTGFDIRKVTR